MAANTETFETWEFTLLETFQDRSGKDWIGWIVPAPFCHMKYINDGRFLIGDRAPADRRTRQNNVQFVQMISPQSGTELRNLGVIAIKACGNIDAKEELNVDYGSIYSFSRI